MWKKGMGNCEAVQWPDMNGAARQAKLRLLMLNQTTGKARDYVFESITRYGQRRVQASSLRSRAS
jgi:hypothetical protein